MIPFWQSLWQIRSDSYTVSGLVSIIKEYDAAMAQVLNVPSSEFELVISGGDRYKDSNGDICSRTTNEMVKESAEKSPHLVGRGARAVDFSARKSDKRITTQVLKKAMNIVNKHKNKINQIKNDYDDGHIHLSIPYSQSGEYNWNSHPFKKPYISGQEEDDDN